MINITLQNLAGKSIPVMLKENFDLVDFKKVAEENFNPVENYRFYMENNLLDLNNEAEFNKHKSKIVDDKTIFVLGRLRGGGFLDTATFVDIILIDLPDVLKKVRKTQKQCVVCCLNKPCFKVCHAMECEDCFTQYFKTSNLQIKCTLCPAVVPPKTVLFDSGFCSALESYSQLQNLLKNIDCQVCKCGALVMNETMYAKQTCIKCFRDFCFFCNKDWNAEKMREGLRYTCSSGNCDYETRINFNLIKFVFNPAEQIPDRRCCPKCFVPGYYGERCKYNTCLTCEHRFCFFCLETEPKCFAKYGKTYSEKCTEPVKQTYSMFPRLNTA